MKVTDAEPAPVITTVAVKVADSEGANVTLDLSRDPVAKPDTVNTAFTVHETVPSLVTVNVAVLVVGPTISPKLMVVSEGDMLMLFTGSV